MKKQLLSLLLFCFNLVVYAQDTYTLQIVNTQNQPLKSTEVTALNSDKNVTLKASTDNTGTVVFTLSVPGKYTFSYLDMKDATSYVVREGGGRGFSEKRITYDPKKVFAIQPNVSRTGIVFKTVPCQQLKGQQNIAKVTIEVLSSNEDKVPSVLVEVVSCIDQTKYKGYSNGIGVCTFYIPNNKDYEIDIDGTESVGKFNVPNYPNIEFIQTAYYEKMKVNETVKGDSIFQSQVTQTGGTNSHVLFILTLKDFEDNVLKNEPIYINAQNKKTVYVGKTDEKGICKLMIKKGDDYLVNLKYERDIRLLEAKNINGYATFTSTRRYRGSAAVEKIMAEQKAEIIRLEEERKRMEIEAAEYAKKMVAMAKENEKLRIQYEKEAEVRRIQAEKEFDLRAQASVTFHETPVRPAEVPTNYIKKTATGFDIDFNAEGPIGTPTMVEDKLYTQAGYYSPNYYCLQAKTGQYVWGVELGESGISPAVYQNGILLINTASCTLYALDAKTGKLLWSKWLSNYLFTSPTAVGNTVYVVYNHGGMPALVSFDLTTGKYNWMRRVDNEVIACPVVEGNEVHVASQSGTYYIFDKDTGRPIISSSSVKAISSPTITADKIYLTASVNGTDQLVVLNRTTLKIEKKYATPLQSIRFRYRDQADQMNFNGSHPIVYQNKVVIITDQTKIVALDAQSEKQLWEQPVQIASSQIPIIANNQVIIGTTTGEVVSYDIYTGAKKILQKNKEAIQGQPMAHNGLLYIASAGIISVINSVQNFQWEQWNKDASHNLYWR